MKYNPEDCCAVLCSKVNQDPKTSQEPKRIEVPIDDNDGTSCVMNARDAIERPGILHVDRVLAVILHISFYHLPHIDSSRSLTAQPRRLLSQNILSSTARSRNTARCPQARLSIGSHTPIMQISKQAYANMLLQSVDMPETPLTQRQVSISSSRS